MAFVGAGMLVVGALTPVARPDNWRPRGSATTGTAPAKLAWLVLSTLAATVSGLSYQIMQSGTCASAGGEDIFSNLAECTAAGEALSIASKWNLEYDSRWVPSGCVVTSDHEALYFNPRDTNKACGTAASDPWYGVCHFTIAYSPSPPPPPPGAPDYGCWRLSDTSESCTARCSNLGGCSEPDVSLHASEIDSHAEVVALFEDLTGKDCGANGAGYNEYCYLELIWRYVAAEADKAAAVVDREEMPLEFSEARLVHRAHADSKHRAHADSKEPPS